MRTKAFIDHNGKILIIRESKEYRDEDAGSWDAPGGRIKSGEDPIDALRREIKEETELNVEIKEPFYIAD